jgi:energy-coupling factor transporter ATP-binding protein EcfA2
VRTLVRSVGRADIGGEPLPSVFRAFENNKIILRRAEVSMLAGTPGVGKSTLALALALKMKVPSLYISADTNAHTMAMRLASMISGKNQTDVEQLMNVDYGWTKATLAKGSHIVWSFESSPTLQDIDEEVQAFEELWGCPPTAIFVDNLMDIATDGGEEFASMRAIMKELKYLARATNAAIIILHHTSEAVSGDPCQPRSALQGKVAQLPALICTLGVVGTSMAVAPVKNRYGRADASANLLTWLAFNPEYMFMDDIPENA